MPYKYVEVQARKLMQYKGIKIYCTYKYDEVEQSASSFYFVTEPYRIGEDAFDIRKLPGWITPLNLPLHGKGYEDYVKWFLKKCIDEKKFLT